MPGDAGRPKGDIKSIEAEPICEKLNSIQIKIIYQYFYEGKTESQIENNIGWDLIKIKALIKKFRRWLKQRRRVNLRFLNKQKKLKNEYLIYLKELINKKEQHPLTSEEIRIQMYSKFPDLNGISKSTLSRWLHTELHMSYKKLSLVDKKLLNQDEVSKMLRWAVMIKQLHLLKVEIVYIDEFSVSERAHKQYGWRSIGKKSLYFSKKNIFSCSFMVDLSSFKYYPALEVKGIF